MSMMTLSLAGAIATPMTTSAIEIEVRQETARLAAWQERKVARHIGEHLDQPITVQHLAALARLSASHFSRRFKASFGLSPRAYVIRSRLKRAQSLMRQSRTPLCDIALDCGFCDQAHMSRLFHTVIGDTPARWRRQQASNGQQHDL
ncbi:AraC family transcriptional regulator [Caulobacter sp.]|uniref:AraC family transcriptional regulator n=1 Tax=Caulobacter sp. TaxID=78 RepID=UPI0031E0E9B8